MKIVIAVYSQFHMDSVFAGRTREDVSKQVRAHLLPYWEEDVGIGFDDPEDDDFFEQYFDRFPEEGLEFFKNVEVK
jgi:hypothetical protein